MTYAPKVTPGGRLCRTLCAFVVAATLFAGAAEARAAVARYRSTRDLAEGASCIFRGLVLERTAHWQGDVIVTDVLVAVDECWAGDCLDGAAVVRELGGEVDGVGMLPPEPSPLPAGEEVVVFGRRHGAVLEALGGAQGIFRIDPSTDLARRDLSSVVNPPALAEPPAVVEELRREVFRTVAHLEEER